MCVHSKPEFPPLLDAGLHRLTLEELNRLTVDHFPNSETRSPLFAELRKLLALIASLGLKCQIWIDGSFLTEKTNPGDVDFIVDIPVNQLDTLDATQEALVSNLVRQIYRAQGLHSFVLASCPMGHKDYAASLEAKEQWKRDFGFSLVGREPKGIAVIEAKP
jgi:hypothetical protein